MLADAIATLRFGPVLPLNPRTRIPLVAYRDAARDEDGVRLLWKAHPDAGPGVVAGPAGLVVIDIESPNKGGDNGFATMGELTRVIGPLPPTRKHRTKSGGVHLLFRTAAPLRSAQRLIRNRDLPAPGVDIVAGHAVLRFPPTPGYTLAADRPVAELPAAWVTALGEAPAKAASVHGDPVSADARHRAYALAALESEARALEALAGLRNPALARAAYVVGGLVPALTQEEIELVLMEACRGNGSAKEHGERACLSTIRRCTKAGALHPRRLPT